MKRIRLGIHGLGAMGITHARSILSGKVEGFDLVAISDKNPERHLLLREQQAYTGLGSMLRGAQLDAVLICTPHYDHTESGIQALQAGIHVLIEKPISAHKADALRLLEAHQGPQQVFAAMFNQRTDPYFREIRRFVQSGELGAVRRVLWTITDWFRTWSYYRAGSWRATWKGEGGGVLLNQCPHNLDLLQWLFGMPTRLRAHCHFGKHHPIEVEDEVTAYLEWRNGSTGVFIASTGEAPGLNRLEVVFDQGLLICEPDSLLLWRNEVSTSRALEETTDWFSKPPVREVRIPVSGHGGQHAEILANFGAAIRGEAELIAPAHEGLNSLELANAMLLSTWRDETLSLPIDGAVYAQALQSQIERVEKATALPSPVDCVGSCRSVLAPYETQN